MPARLPPTKIERILAAHAQGDLTNKEIALAEGVHPETVTNTVRRAGTERTARETPAARFTTVQVDELLRLMDERVSRGGDEPLTDKHRVALKALIAERKEFRDTPPLSPDETAQVRERNAEDHPQQWQLEPWEIHLIRRQLASDEATKVQYEKANCPSCDVVCIFPRGAAKLRCPNCGRVTGISRQ